MRACSLVLPTVPHNKTMLGSARELDLPVKPYHYCTIGGAQKAFTNWNNFGYIATQLSTPSYDNQLLMPLDLSPNNISASTIS